MVKRHVDFRRDRPEILVVDQLEGARDHFVEVFFHGAVGAKTVKYLDSAVAFVWDDGSTVQIQVDTDAPLSWEERGGWFSPSYGVKLPRPFWVATAEVRLPKQFRWKLTALGDLSEKEVPLKQSRS